MQCGTRETLRELACSSYLDTARLIDSALSAWSFKVFLCFISKWCLTLKVRHTTFSQHKVYTARSFKNTKPNCPTSGLFGSQRCHCWQYYVCVSLGMWEGPQLQCCSGRCQTQDTHQVRNTEVPACQCLCCGVPPVAWGPKVANPCSRLLSHRDLQSLQISDL